MTTRRTVATILAGLALTALIVNLVYHLAQLALRDNEPQRITCKITGAVHSLIITDNHVSAQHTSARLCDKLTIVNADDKLRLIAFGIHDRHAPYGGITEQTLKPGESLSVTLDQRGAYTFHDHLDEGVQGAFVVQ